MSGMTPQGTTVVATRAAASATRFRTRGNELSTTSARTRDGCARAKAMASAPPKLSPTSTAASPPAAVSRWCARSATSVGMSCASSRSRGVMTVKRCCSARTCR